MSKNTIHIAAYVRFSTDDKNEQRQVVQSWAAQTFDEDDTDAPVRGKVMLEEIAKTDYANFFEVGDAVAVRLASAVSLRAMALNQRVRLVPSSTHLPLASLL